MVKDEPDSQPVISSFEEMHLTEDLLKMRGLAQNAQLLGSFVTVTFTRQTHGGPIIARE